MWPECRLDKLQADYKLRQYENIQEPSTDYQQLTLGTHVMYKQPQRKLWYQGIISSIVQDSGSYIVASIRSHKPPSSWQLELSPQTKATPIHKKMTT